LALDPLPFCVDIAVEAGFSSHDYAP
jgi:hypothetical protein